MVFKFIICKTREEMAKEKGIENYTSMKKAELLDALK